MTAVVVGGRGGPVVRVTPPQAPVAVVAGMPRGPKGDPGDPGPSGALAPRPFASLPAANATPPGTSVYCPDVEATYVTDGSSWSVQSTRWPQPALVELTPASIATVSFAPGGSTEPIPELTSGDFELPLTRMVKVSLIGLVLTGSLPTGLRYGIAWSTDGGSTWGSMEATDVDSVYVGFYARIPDMTIMLGHPALTFGPAPGDTVRIRVVVIASDDTHDAQLSASGGATLVATVQ